MNKTELLTAVTGMQNAIVKLHDPDVQFLEALTAFRVNVEIATDDELAALVEQWQQIFPPEDKDNV